jgi:light-regulated signal transduction histidine kinase (bacteriophytochrome)
MGKAALRKSLVNMNELVQDVIDELRAGGMSIPIIQIGELRPAVADINLMKQVWINLISNAIKYSSKTKESVIEIRMEHAPGKHVYAIQDNGVGFDMKYYNKLFGVFQRLHNQSEFAGTGVGLALVQRVIHRHEGAVWAESKLNEGTTFYFSLPDAAVPIDY